MARWWRRGDADPAPPHAQSATGGSGSVAAPPVQRAAWRDLPPLRPTLTSTPPIAPRDSFTASLATSHNPSFLAPLGHIIDPDGPSGHVEGLASPVAPKTISSGPDLPVAQRQEEPKTSVVQRLLSPRMWLSDTSVTPAGPIQATVQREPTFTGPDVQTPTATADHPRQLQSVLSGISSVVPSTSYTAAPDQDVARTLPVVSSPASSSPAPSSPAPSSTSSLSPASIPIVSRHAAEDHPHDHGPDPVQVAADHGSSTQGTEVQEAPEQDVAVADSSPSIAPLLGDASPPYESTPSPGPEHDAGSDPALSGTGPMDLGAASAPVQRSTVSGSPPRTPGLGAPLAAIPPRQDVPAAQRLPASTPFTPESGPALSGAQRPPAVQRATDPGSTGSDSGHTHDEHLHRPTAPGSDQPQDVPVLGMSGLIGSPDATQSPVATTGQVGGASGTGPEPMNPPAGPSPSVQRASRPLGLGAPLNQDALTYRGRTPSPGSQPNSAGPFSVTPPPAQAVPSARTEQTAGEYLAAVQRMSESVGPGNSTGLSDFSSAPLGTSDTTESSSARPFPSQAPTLGQELTHRDSSPGPTDSVAADSPPADEAETSDPAAGTGHPDELILPITAQRSLADVELAASAPALPSSFVDEPRGGSDIGDTKPPVAVAPLLGGAPESPLTTATPTQAPPVSAQGPRSGATVQRSAAAGTPTVPPGNAGNPHAGIGAPLPAVPMSLGSELITARELSLQRMFAPGAAAITSGAAYSDAPNSVVFRPPGVSPPTAGLPVATVQTLSSSNPSMTSPTLGASFGDGRYGAEQAVQRFGLPSASSLMSGARKAASGVADTARQTVGGYADTARQTVGGYADQARGYAETAASKASGYADTARETAGGYLNQARGYADNAASSAGGYLNSARETAGGVADSAAETASGYLASARSAAGGAADQASGAVGDAASAAQGAVGGAGEAVSTAAGGAQAAAGDAISGAAGAVAGAVGSVGGAAAGAAGALPTDLDELARRLFDPLSARLKSELWLDRERAGMVTDLRR